MPSSIAPREAKRLQSRAPKLESPVIQLCVSAEILAEYEGMLSGRKFLIEPARLAGSLALIRDAAATFVSSKRVTAATDPGDNKFLECAESASAAYPVTGNKRHFPTTWKSTKVINARELIEMLIPDLQSDRRSG